METSLHRELKERFGAGGRTEVVVRGFRIDAVDAAGELIEVQAAALGPLRSKLSQLLPSHRVRVVKPVMLRRRIVRRSHREGRDLSVRSSPIRRKLFAFFDDFVGLASLFPQPNLTIEVLGVVVDEVRLPRRRRPGYEVIDRRLLEIVETTTLASASDLWDLLPDDRDWQQPFHTRELAASLGCDLGTSQRVAYGLRLAGATRTVGKYGNAWVYEREAVAEVPPRSSVAIQGRSALKCCMSESSIEQS